MKTPGEETVASLRADAAERIEMNPADALHQMLQSEGFALFIGHVRTRWGNAAQLSRIKTALVEHPAGDHSALTQSVIGTADAIKELFAWPEEEIGRLRGQAAQSDAPVDNFAQHRRIGG